MIRVIRVFGEVGGNETFELVVEVAIISCFFAEVFENIVDGLFHSCDVRECAWENCQRQFPLRFVPTQSAVKPSRLPAFQQRVVKAHLVTVFNHLEAAFGQTAQQIG